jgi:uncharacterized protein DUF4440
MNLRPGPTIVLLAAVTAFTASSDRPLSIDSPPGLLATNSARFTAMVREDFAALDTLLGPDLTYVHSDGVLESRAQFLTTLRTRRLRYQAIDPSELQARTYDNMGIVTGRSHMRVKAGTELLAFEIRFTAVYRRVGHRWELVAWQATRLSGR